MGAPLVAVCFGSMAGEQPLVHSLKILFITGYYKPAYIYGGPVNSVSTLCEALARLGCRVTVFTTNANGQDRLDIPTSQPIDLNGVEVWYFPLGMFSKYFYSAEQVHAVRTRVNEFDLVVSEVLWEILAQTILHSCRRASVPYLVTPRGQLLPWSLEQSRLKKRIFLLLIGYNYLRNAAGILCTDPSEAQAIQEIFPGAKVLVNPNGIDLQGFQSLPPRGCLRSQFNIPSDSIVLLFLGRLHKKKQPEIAVRVCAALQSRFHPHLFLVGPDEDENFTNLDQLTTELGLEEKVHCLGLLTGDEKLQAIVDSDLFLMPSVLQSENFGMAALEALACGLPILTTNDVPVGSWAQQHHIGQITEPTLESFSAAATAMLSDMDGLAEMGRQARVLSHSVFDSEIVAQRMLDYYREIISNDATLRHPLETA